MRKRSIFFIVIIISFLFSVPVWAQGEGFTETFEDASLSEWEHTPEVVVSDGVLKIGPGNFALRFGDWTDVNFSVKLKTTGQAEFVVHYNFRDESRYALVFLPEELIFEKDNSGELTPLGNASLSGIAFSEGVTLSVVMAEESHQISINDQVVITASDAEPLPAGALMFMVHGGSAVEIDDLTFKGAASQVEGPQPEGELPPESAAPIESAATTATAQSGQITSVDDLLAELFSSQANDLQLTTFVINMFLAAVCAYILSLVYIYWGSSLTNRRKFAANFMLLTLTTTFIILVVRSSVALSLGLVGALSIVRFRTAVKEAEELAYLFFAISLGIGLGDNQRLITVLALLGGIAIIGLTKLFRKSQADVNLHLTVASHTPDLIGLEQITAVLDQHCSKVKLIRFDENQQTVETSFLVEFKKLSNLNAARDALKTLSDSAEITFLDNKGIW
jgi:hypothetical protein